MLDKLTDALTNAGMIQTGYFANHDHPGKSVPFRIHLDMLPAYPDVLVMIGERMAEKLQQRPVERLMCPMDSLPLGVAVSLAAGIPLVYSRGQGEAPNYDLVGAYDVGHPAALVINQLSRDSEATFSHLQSQAAKVGLELEYGLAVVGLRTSPDFEALLPMEAIIDQLAAAAKLSIYQRDIVVRYLHSWSD